MIPLQLDEIIRFTKGKLLTPYIPRLIKGISTDTRTINKGSLFIALKGNNFDGHNFIIDAIKQKASVIILSRIPSSIKKELRLNNHTSFIKVDDTVKALGNIAAYYRRKLSAKVIAIGGSNGKTTTKDMIAHILSKRYQVVKSPRSYNNFIGLPLTILSADNHTEYLVAEVGTNQPGEISYLAKILKPDISVITNISATHLEGLKDLEGVFKEESSLFKNLSSDKIALFESSNKRLKRLSKYAEYKTITFGMDSEATIRAKGIQIKPDYINFSIAIKGQGYHKCNLPVLGAWNIKNALASFAVSYTIGMKPAEICKALADFKLPAMRMEKYFVNGVTFINDAYNANPTSVALTIRELSEMKMASQPDRLGLAGRKVFVLGEMRELGKYSRRFHQDIADDIAKSNIDILIAIGNESKWTMEKLSGIKTPNILSFYYKDISEAIPYIKKIIRKNDMVLLKGSRTNSLEKIILCYTN
ncbi:MAG: UDP-N-acetylmuramoyl-tripeptide--D-alanyl-D-alanine ligase [Planctomycetota bacterium]